MRRSRPIAFLASVAVPPPAAMAFAACGGGAATAPSKRTTAPATSATVRVANSRLATAWPPLLANGKPTAGWYALASAGNQIFPQQPSPGGGYGS